MSVRPGKQFFIGLLCGFLLPCLVGFVFMAAGVFDFSASSEPGLVENKLAPWAFERSMARRAPNQSNPFAKDPAAVETGMTHYRENCLVCHGTPDSESSELSMGLNPSAPALNDKGIQQLSDGQIFWIIKNGVRWSGMPAFGMTHEDEEIWKIVSFVRHLPLLTPEEKEKLNQPAEPDHHHHHEGDEGHKETE